MRNTRVKNWGRDQLLGPERKMIQKNYCSEYSAILDYKFSFHNRLDGYITMKILV